MKTNYTGFCLLTILSFKFIFFSISFIGEETSSSEKKIPDLTDSPTWIIDPIDGTINFCKNLPMTVISIALAVNKQIVIGIVYNACIDEMFTAKRGKGAFLNGKPIHVSKETDVWSGVTLT